MAVGSFKNQFNLKIDTILLATNGGSCTWKLLSAGLLSGEDNYFCFNKERTSHVCEEHEEFKGELISDEHLRWK